MCLSNINKICDADTSAALEENPPPILMIAHVIGWDTLHRWFIWIMIWSQPSNILELGILYYGFYIFVNVIVMDFWLLDIR